MFYKADGGLGAEAFFPELKFRTGRLSSTEGDGCEHIYGTHEPLRRGHAAQPRTGVRKPRLIQRTR